METLANIIEAILFISGKEVAIQDITDKLGVTESEVMRAAETLKSKYDATESGITLLVFNKKLQFCSNERYAEDVANVLNPIKERELSRSMLEVVAIVAYKQPVTRLDIEQLRGVNSEFAVQNLLRLNMIEVVGRKDTIGKPLLFGTTDEFLKRFKIASLDELPDYDTLIEQITALHGGNETYLFHKDEYDEANDPDYADFGNDTAENVTDEIAATSDDDEGDDFDMKPIDEEETPDFLKDEDVEIIE
ncbi:MAG: SMC-Scp complex subunit ScpB [Clostridia bacterium]|nr:SMC-Scp complex subunit ScpB [Clostridia bacterium]